jgi:hypothetical protein
MYRQAVQPAPTHRTRATASVHSGCLRCRPTVRDGRRETRKRPAAVLVFPRSAHAGPGLAPSAALFENDSDPVTVAGKVESRRPFAEPLDCLDGDAVVAPSVDSPGANTDRLTYMQTTDDHERSRSTHTRNRTLHLGAVPDDSLSSWGKPHVRRPLRLVRPSQPVADGRAVSQGVAAT